MRFVRKEKVIITLCDEEIKDEDNIKETLEDIFKHRIEFSIILKKYFSSISETKYIVHEKARIKSCKDNTIDLIVFNDNTVTQIKDITFAEINEINATTTINRIGKLDDKLTIFELLDLT